MTRTLSRVATGIVLTAAGAGAAAGVLRSVRRRRASREGERPRRIIARDEHVERLDEDDYEGLDATIAQSFPASDPPSSW